MKKKEESGRCGAEYWVGDWNAEWQCELDAGHEGPHEARWTETRFMERTIGLCLQWEDLGPSKWETEF